MLRQKLFQSGKSLSELKIRMQDQFEEMGDDLSEFVPSATCLTAVKTETEAILQRLVLFLFPPLPETKGRESYQRILSPIYEELKLMCLNYSDPMGSYNQQMANLINEIKNRVHPCSATFTTIANALIRLEKLRINDEQSKTKSLAELRQEKSQDLIKERYALTQVELKHLNKIEPYAFREKDQLNDIYSRLLDDVLLKLRPLYRYKDPTNPPEAFNKYFMLNAQEILASHLPVNERTKKHLEAFNDFSRNFLINNSSYNNEDSILQKITEIVGLPPENRYDPIFVNNEGTSKSKIMRDVILAQVHQGLFKPLMDEIEKLMGYSVGATQNYLNLSKKENDIFISLSMDIKTLIKLGKEDKLLCSIMEKGKLKEYATSEFTDIYPDFTYLKHYHPSLMQIKAELKLVEQNLLKPSFSLTKLSFTLNTTDLAVNDPEKDYEVIKEKIKEVCPDQYAQISLSS